jgi:hypothetical protein
MDCPTLRNGFLRIGQQLAASGPRKVDPLPDLEYLDRLAARLAHVAGIAPDLARARVQALAISARPRESHGFEDRCR